MKGVFAVAKEREMIVANPFEEGARFRKLGFFDRVALRRKLGNRVAEFGGDRLPVLDRRADVRKHALDPRLKIGHRTAGQRVDLDVHPRLGREFVPAGLAGRKLKALAGVSAAQPQHRMDDQLDSVPSFAKLKKHRIEEEGHIVVDHLDHGARGGPALLFNGRREYPDLGGAGRALFAKFP